MEYEEGKRRFAVLPSVLIANRFPCNSLWIDDELKGSIQSSPLGPSGLLGMGSKPFSLGQVVITISHEGWLSPQVDTPGWSMRERTSVEPRGERVDRGNSALEIEIKEQRLGVDVKNRKGVGSFGLT